MGEFDAARTAACVIVKHANPCGVAENADLVEAYRRALACDSTSAYGGIVALNRTLDADAARAITEIFTEVIIAPDATEEAIAIVAARRNLRLLLAGGVPAPRAMGLPAPTHPPPLLVQRPSNPRLCRLNPKGATQPPPPATRLPALPFSSPRPRLSRDPRAAASGARESCAVSAPDAGFVAARCAGTMGTRPPPAPAAPVRLRRTPPAPPCPPSGLR